MRALPGPNGVHTGIDDLSPERAGAVHDSIDGCAHLPHQSGVGSAADARRRAAERGFAVDGRHHIHHNVRSALDAARKLQVAVDVVTSDVGGCVWWNEAAQGTLPGRGPLPRGS
jgi:hypothetical protein